MDLCDWSIRVCHRRYILFMALVGYLLLASIFCRRLLWTSMFTLPGSWLWLYSMRAVVLSYSSLRPSSSRMVSFHFSINVSFDLSTPFEGFFLFVREPHFLCCIEPFLLSYNLSRSYDEISRSWLPLLWSLVRLKKCLASTSSRQRDSLLASRSPGSTNIVSISCWTITFDAKHPVKMLISSSLWTSLSLQNLAIL